MIRSIVGGFRTFVLVPVLFVYTMILALVIVVAVAIDPTTKLQDRIVLHWSRLFLKVPPVSVETSGIEHLDPHQRYVVVSNHLSMFDIPLLFRELPIHGRFLAKKELFRLPMIGRGMRAIGIIEIDRQAGGSSRAAIAEGVTIAAERGYSLIVFPEGTRSTEGRLLPFKKGAFRIAIDTGLPVLPVVIEGTDRISRPGSKLFHAGTARLRILEPIATDAMTNRDDLNPLLARVEAALNDTYAEMREIAATRQ
jgi:1-acyl-sn-glycerol-3-phosphate acyltransferase